MVYVDSDDWSVAEGRRLSGHAHAEFAQADLRAPERVLESAQCRALLDLTEPIGVLLVDVLHHIPDTDQPARFIRTYAETVWPGSYLAVSHLCWDEALFTGTILFDRLYPGRLPALTFRDAMQVRETLAGLHVVDPGVVPIPLWHPEPDQNTDRHRERFPGHAALARIPSATARQR